MTTRTNEVPAALALINAVVAYLQEQPYSGAKKRFLRSDGLPWLAKRIAHLEAENERLLRQVGEHPVTFNAGDMIAAIEAEVAEAANA